VDTTKKYFKNFWVIFGIFSAIVTPTVIAFAVKDTFGMIAYYCTNNNPFFGFYLQSYPFCPVYAAIGFILSIVLGIMLLCFWDQSCLT
jgi:hypothetical protein